MHISIVIHPGSNNYLQIHNIINGNMLSSSLKKQHNGKFPLNNDILCIVYSMTIDMLIKIYTLPYNVFISLIFVFLKRLVELSTSQPKL